MDFDCLLEKTVTKNKKERSRNGISCTFAISREQRRMRRRRGEQWERRRGEEWGEGGEEWERRRKRRRVGEKEEKIEKGGKEERQSL